MNLLLHVGMPKCGSSALQSYLSTPEFSDVASNRYVYVALHQDGKLWWGESLHNHASSSSFGYCSSHMGSALSSLNSKQKRSVKAQLIELGQQFNTLIFSNEGWGPNPEHFDSDCLFSEPEFDVSVIAYIRPQVEWMNSAWWQWGAWTEAPHGKWVNNNRPKAKWASLSDLWLNKPWVNNVDLRLLQSDVAQDFMEYLGYSIPTKQRSNQSLSAILLRVMQRNRVLRPGPHDSAIEFAFSRHLKMATGSTPWVLRHPMIENLIAYYKDDNEQLLRLLPVNQKQKMLDDVRWWQTEAYSSKVISPPQAKHISIQDLEELTVSALSAVNDLDTEVRRLSALLASSNN